MNLYLPRFKYKYKVTPEGIAPAQLQFEDADDKQLYISIMKSLNVDFKNAPVDITRINPLQQKIVYVIENNTHYEMQVDQLIDIRTGKESVSAYEYNKIMRASNGSTFLDGQTDLQ